MSAAGLQRSSDRWAIVRLGVVGLVLVVVTAIGPLLHHRMGGFAHWIVIAITATGAAWATFAADRTDPQWAFLVIAVAAAAMRLLQLAIDPYLSDDIYRYIWDGRVQAAGINPYRYVPAAPELYHLRDDTIYPNINRAEYAPTIYPPMAQIFFLIITRLSESVLFMKLALLACEGIAIAATLRLLGHLELHPTRIAAFAWHPLPVWEIAGSGHIDALMVAGIMVTLVVFVNGRGLPAGAMATAVALVKPTALLLLPVFWRPWGLALPAVVVATALLLYLPYLSVGWQVLGFLPGYIAEEGLDQAHGFRYLALIDSLIVKVPHGAVIYAVALAICVMGLALVASFRRDRTLPGTLCMLTVLLTAFLLLLTPHYPWYYLCLVPFLAFYPWSLTLWLLTAGSMQMYQAIPDDPLPDYLARQYVFHTLALAAVARDFFRARRERGLIEFGASSK